MDGIAVASTALAVGALWHAIKMGHLTLSMPIWG